MCLSTARDAAGPESCSSLDRTSAAPRGPSGGAGDVPLAYRTVRCSRVAAVELEGSLLIVNRLLSLIDLVSRISEGIDHPVDPGGWLRYPFHVRTEQLAYAVEVLRWHRQDQPRRSPVGK